MNDLKNLRGVIHGNVIELEEPLGLPEGQSIRVSVSLGRVALPSRWEDLPGFGALAESPEEVEEFDRWYRSLR